MVPGIAYLGIAVACADLGYSIAGGPDTDDPSRLDDAANALLRVARTVPLNQPDRDALEVAHLLCRLRRERVMWGRP